MALVDAAKIEQYLDVDAALAARLEAFVRLAETYLCDLKGAGYCDDMLALPASDEERMEAEHAASLLCLYYGLPHLSLRVDASGGIIQVAWQDDGAGTKVETRYAGATSLRTLRRELLRQARMLVQGDVTVTESGEGESTLISSVETGAGFFIGAVVD